MPTISENPKEMYSDSEKIWMKYCVTTPRKL